MIPAIWRARAKHEQKWRVCMETERSQSAQGVSSKMARPSQGSMRIYLCRDERELIHVALFEYVYYARYTDEREKTLAQATQKKIARTLQNERERERAHG